MITAGKIIEIKPPNITRSNGEVRKVKIMLAIRNPTPAAAKADSEIFKSFDKMPGKTLFRATRRLLHANAYAITPAHPAPGNPKAFING